MSRLEPLPLGLKKYAEREGAGDALVQFFLSQRQF